MEVVIGVRELSRSVSRVVNDLAKKKRTVLITNHGKPIAIMIPVDQGILETFLSESVNKQIAAAIKRRG